MEHILSQLLKEANKPKHSSIRKACQESLDLLGDREISASAAPYQIRERCLAPLQLALQSKSTRLSIHAIAGLQQILVDERFQSSMESEEQCRWLPMQVLNTVQGTSALPDVVQVDVMKLLLNMAVTSSWCMNAPVIISIARLCFTSMAATSRNVLQSVIVSLFLRVLHSFAEGVLALAAPPREVMVNSYSSSGPCSIRTAVKAAFIQLLSVFVDKLRDVANAAKISEKDSIAEFSSNDKLVEAEALGADFVTILHYLCDTLGASSSTDQAEPLLLEGILILLSGAPPVVIRKHDFHCIVWQKLCPSLIQLLANPLSDKTVATRSAGGDDVGRGSGCSAAAPNLPTGAAKAIYGIAMELVRSVGRFASLRPVIESLFHRIFLYPSPVHRLDAIRAVHPLLSSAEGLVILAGPLIDDVKATVTPGGAKKKHDAELALLKLIVDSLQECCHCNDMAVAVTSIDIVNDLLNSVEQLIRGPEHVLNDAASNEHSFSVSPSVVNGHPLAATNATSVSPSSSLGAVLNKISDADVIPQSCDATSLSTDVDVVPATKDADAYRRISRASTDTSASSKSIKFDIAERECAAHFVHRLFEFLPSLAKASIPTDADGLLQEFASSFCTDLLTSGPDAILNADAVYVTSYSVLQLVFMLRQSAYFTSKEKSLPLSEQQFVDDILNMGLLLYVSRTWLSEVFHLIIADDLLCGIGGEEMGLPAGVATLLNDIDGLKRNDVGGQLLTSYQGSNQFSETDNVLNRKSIDPALMSFGRRILTACWDGLLDILSVLTTGRGSCGIAGSIVLIFNAREESRKARQAICTSLDGLQKAARLSSILGMHDRCGAVFEHLAAASCVVELDDIKRERQQQQQQQQQQQHLQQQQQQQQPSLGDKKSVASALTSASRPKLARLHAAHALSMDVLLGIGLEMGSHTADCWKHVFRCCAHIAELEHTYFSGGDNQTSLPHLNSGPLRPQPVFADQDNDNDDVGYADMYSRLPAVAEPVIPTVTVQQLVQQYSAEAGWDNRVVGGGVLSPAQASKVLCRLSHEVDRLFEDAANKLNLKALVGFLTELCEYSRQQLASHGRQVTATAGSTTTPNALHLYRLGDIVSKCIASERPRLHLMRVWNIVASHFVEAACHRDQSVSKKAVDCIHDAVTALLGSYSELPHFHFNESLCKPFENLLCLELCDGDIQDQVVCSVCELVEACTTNIKSGWKPLFGALRAVKIQYTANEQVNETRQRHIAAVLDVFDVFLATDNIVVFANAAVDCILCLLKYVRGPGEFEMKDFDDSSDSETEASSFVDGQDLCLPALRYLRQCCDIIASMYRMPGCPVFAGAHRIHVGVRQPTDSNITDLNLESFHNLFTIISTPEPGSDGQLEQLANGGSPHSDDDCTTLEDVTLSNIISNGDDTQNSDETLSATESGTVDHGLDGDSHETGTHVTAEDRLVISAPKSTGKEPQNDVESNDQSVSPIADMLHDFETDRSGALRVYFLVIEGLSETVSACPKNYQPQTLEMLFELMRAASRVPGAKFVLHCINTLLLPTLQSWLHRGSGSVSVASGAPNWDTTSVANFKHYTGLCVDLVVELVIEFANQRPLESFVELTLQQQLNVLVECLSQPLESISRLGCSCVRHCLLNCGPVLTESMWWTAASILRRAFDTSLLLLRQLMTPFHENSENFYGDVGQVKVAIRQDSTPLECARLQQLSRQVFLLDSQCSANASIQPSTDEDKSYVFLIYAPDSAESNLPIARVPFRNLVVGLVSHQLLIQTVGSLLLCGSPNSVPAEHGIVIDASASGRAPSRSGSLCVDEDGPVLMGNQPMPGMLPYMSSRVFLALVDCLRSSYDAAMQFDARPGLKFLVQKVSRADVAANLYKQAGVAHTVYTHVLLEVSARIDNLSVRNVRQILAGGGTSEEKSAVHGDAVDSEQIAVNALCLDEARCSTKPLLAHSVMCIRLLKSAFDESCSHYIELFLEREGPSAADRLSESLLVFLFDEDAPLPSLPRERSLREMVKDKLRRRRQSSGVSNNADQDSLQESETNSGPVLTPTNDGPSIHSHKAVPEDRIYTVATDRTIKSVMSEYRKRKQANLMPKATTTSKTDTTAKSKLTKSGKTSRSHSLSSSSDPLDRQIAEQQKASIMKDGEAHLRSSVEMLCNGLQLMDQLPDGDYHALLPVAFSCVAQLVGHCRDRQLRETLARWTYRVGFLFEFTAPGDHLTPVKY